MIHGILKLLWSPVSDVLDSDIVIPFAAPLSIISNQPAYAQDAMNLSRRASSQGIQRWEITTNLSPTNNSSDVLVHSTYYGTYNPFYVTMPQVHGLTVSTVAITTTTAAGIGSNAMTVSEAMTPGEFFNVGLDTKVYMVTAYNSGVIAITPNLLRPCDSGAVLKRGRNTVLFCRYDKDVQIGIKYVDGILADHGSVKLVEAI